MERNLGFKMVQGQIGYTFKNLDLLNQAFTRRSYSEENGGENNEVLEFIGDKVLDLAVVKILTDKFGKIENNEFVCSYTEGDLTKLKSRMVEKRTLSHRIDELGFAELLLMGNSDIKNNVSNEMSVKEDLFEAIIGAVTIDSGWNYSVIHSVVEAMLIPEDFFKEDSDDNYVRLIYDWEMSVNHVLPWFWYKERSYSIIWYMKEPGVLYQNFPLDYDTSKLKYHCELKLLDNLPVFCGFGVSKSEARMNVCKFAYEYLKKRGYIRNMTMRDEIDEPTKDSAINQLEILARRNYFSIPTYEFEESHDNDGNPIWRSRCRIKEYEKSFSSTSSSKKEAKKLAALEMLEYVIGDEDKKSSYRITDR